MRRRLIISTLLAATLPAGLLAGCAGRPSPAPTPQSTETGVLVKAAAAKQTPVDAAQLAQAEQGSAEFGLALLRKLGADGQSMVYSPQTLVDLLGMLLPGAQGETATALAKTLGADGLGPDTVAAALGEIDATARADANQDSNTLDESSDVWAADGLALRQGYLAALNGAFRTGVHQTDFAHDATGSTTAIDNLVAQETHGYIKNLFAPGSIATSTQLVLTDAVYLNAAWQRAFDPYATSVLPFYPSTGAPKQAPMMQDIGTYKYAAGNGWQAVELPYVGDKLAMDVLLPAKGPDTLATLRDGLTVSSLNAMLGALGDRQVEVQLPKFTTDTDANGLEQDLSALGLASLFDQADFGAMFTGGTQTYVSQIVEKAHIAVGEKGTVAAAAAGGAVADSGRVAPPLTFVADHPFLYLVRDLSTGQLLFAGQLATP